MHKTMKKTVKTTVGEMSLEYALNPEIAKENIARSVLGYGGNL